MTRKENPQNSRALKHDKAGPVVYRNTEILHLHNKYFILVERFLLCIDTCPFYHDEDYSQ